MDKNLNNKKLTKNIGQVFTPTYLVKNILDFAGYTKGHILGKHIIDNSCGDGAFLTEVVHRYCQEAIYYGISKAQIKKELETYIHGIEIEDNAYSSLIINLNKTAEAFGIIGTNWDLIHGDALTIANYESKMDYVVGNPPYVRIHNIDKTESSIIKEFKFAKEGMTDMYLVFFELGFRMLNINGRLCYITPSSWLSSIAGSTLREHIRSNKDLLGVIDLGHYQPFEATAYTLISLIEKGTVNNNVEYFTYDSTNKKEQHISTLSYSQFDISGNFYFSHEKTLKQLRAIKKSNVQHAVSVKNGFATLADKIFIGDVPECKITIPIIKASTGKWYKGLFPYYKNGTPIESTTLFQDPRLENYYLNHKEILQKGLDNGSSWLYYGRTQAIKDVHKNKFAINTIISNKESIKINFVPAGCGIYSGLYILGDITEKQLRNIIISDEFVDYIHSLKNYKSGGYFTFNSKDLEQYINYKLSEYDKK